MSLPISIEPLPIPTIVICAHNEQDYIGRTIGLIQETGLNVHIIVVNDGSTDRTSEIAKTKTNVEVIDLPRNVGKANAFFAGLRFALKNKPSCIVTLDADMLTVPKNDLNELIRRAETSSKQVKMFVASIHERGNQFPTRDWSGIRSFSIVAAYKLLTSPLKKFPKGYGLEQFLNSWFRIQNLFTYKDRLENTGFQARAPCAKIDVKTQEKHMNRLGFNSKYETELFKRVFRYPRRI